MQISQRRILTIQDRSLPYSIGAPPGLLIVIFALVAFFSMGILPIFVARDLPRSTMEWLGTLFLGIILFQFFNVLTKKVVFQ
jgi:hypothetical protein